MRRKLVKQGQATYTVSLPKEWVERFNLKSGEEIDIDESGTQLILSTIEKNKKYETIKFNLANIPEDLIHEFAVSLYKSGLKDIEIEKTNPKKTKETEEVVSNTIGFQILGLENNQIHIVDLGTSDESSIIKAEQQIYWRLLHMIDRIIDKKSTNKEIHDIDLEINKLSFFIQRNISTRFSSNTRNFMIYEKISILESIGDYFRSFKMYSSIEEEEINYLKKVYSILDKLKSNKNDLEHFYELKKLLIQLVNTAEKMKTKSKNSSLAAILIYKNIKQLFDICFTLNISIFEEK